MTAKAGTLGALSQHETTSAGFLSIAGNLWFVTHPIRRNCAGFLFLQAGTTVAKAITCRATVCWSTDDSAKLKWTRSPWGNARAAYECRAALSRILARTSGNRGLEISAALHDQQLGSL